MNLVKNAIKKIILSAELLVMIVLLNWDVLLLTAIVVADQFAKGIITASMTPGESIPVFKHVFHVTYVQNPGAAFGILPNQRFFFVIVGLAFVLLSAAFYSKIKREPLMLRLGILSIMGGAIANLIDRMQNGLVVDFIDFRIWPVFNIADIAIVIGMCCVMYSALFKFGETKSA